MHVKSTVPFFLILVLLTKAALFLTGTIPGRLLPFLGVIISSLYQIFLGNILEYSEYIAGIYLSKNKSLDTSTIFAGFQEYGRIMKGMFWFMLRRTLWLCVPVFGIVKAYSFMMAPNVLYSEPALSPEEVIQKSMQLTASHKMELFIQDLKLTSWRILDTLSMSLVGIIYFHAYNAAIWAGFYHALQVAAGSEGHIPVSKKTNMPTEEENSELPFLTRPKLK